VKVAAGENAADEVLREAAQGYDLIAMAVGSMDRSDNLLFGRVIDRVVREAPCPTIVLKAPAGPEGRELDTILVPTTGTENSRHAVETASLLAQGAGATLTLLHVLTTAEDVLPGEAIASSQAREIAEELVEEQAGIARKLGADVSGRIIEAGLPETAILELAERERFDLVILGASARSVRQRAYLGRCAEALLRSAPCGVAIVCSA
jgi:nucleotide-binding universal stress UspA family protein